MAVKRRRAEAAKDAAVCHCMIPTTFKFISTSTCTDIGPLQNEYAAILAKRVNEEKAKKSELRSKYIPWHLQRSKALHASMSALSPSLH